VLISDKWKDERKRITSLYGTGGCKGIWTRRRERKKEQLLIKLVSVYMGIP